MQSIIGEAISRWKVPAVSVGCSGNFTVERVIGSKFPQHGNDVTLYSAAIGAFLAGDDLDIRVKDDQADRFGWLEESMTSPVDRAATIMLSSRMLLGSQSENPYYARIRQQYRDQWKDLHGRTVTRLNEIPFRLESFHLGDAVEWVLDVPDDHGWICFPPFFEGDYEAMFRNLDKVFDWPEPEYAMLGQDRLEVLVGRLQTKREWIFGNNQRWPELEEFLCGVVQTTNRGVPIYVYGTNMPARVVRPKQKLARVGLTPLMGDDEIEGPIELRILSTAQFSMLRSEYMNHNIRPGTPSMAVAVLAGGKLVGAYAVLWASTQATWNRHLPTPHVYLMSDFPVSGTKYGRLAKLVVMTAMSRESQLLIERHANRRARSITTTAYTDRPVSMKYRGVLKLIRREDSRDPQYRHELQYGAPIGQTTLEEVWAEWQKKHSTSE